MEEEVIAVVVERVVREGGKGKMGGKVYAIDFDGVICEDNYPNIGKPNKAVIDKMEKLHKEGHIIIIWTCRCDDKLEKAKVWLKENNVVFDYINENDKDRMERYGNDSRKIGADFYVDDLMLSVEDFVKGDIEERYKNKSELEQKNLEFADLVIKWGKAENEEEKKDISRKIDEILLEIEVLKKKVGI